MYALILTAFIYLSHFAPWVVSRPLLFVPVLFLYVLLFQRDIERSLQFMITALLFLVLSSSITCSSVTFGFDETEIAALYGTVIQDSSQKKGRMSGYRLSIRAAEDKNGSVATSRGSIYVLSDQAECFYGDYIRVAGYLSDGIFIGSTAIVSRSFGGSIRSEVISWIKDRIRGGGAGELAMRLLLGFGEYGVYALSDDARLSGLSHILALSGMHLSLLASLLSIPLSLFPSKKLRKIVISLFLLFFSFLSGWRPSLVRAFIFRTLLDMRIELDEAFMLSAIILFLLFPEAIADLGAVYSFVSLAAIFLFSSSIDRGIRTLLPLCPSISLSVSASAAAIVFSVPITLSVFGSYQIGAIITTFPMTFIISFYMGLAILVLVLPAFQPLLGVSYAIIEHLFSLSALFPEFSDIRPYLLIAAASIVLIVLGLLSSSHVESQLQQHKRNSEGPFIT